MVLEDYTLKHVWGLKPSTARGIYKDSDPDQGSRRNLHISGAFISPSASANAKRNPTPAKPSAPSCATALFSNRSQGRDGADWLRPASMRPQAQTLEGVTRPLIPRAK